MDAADVTVKVSTETMRSVSNEVLSNLRTTRLAIESLDNILKTTGAYWEGDGQDAQVRAYVSKESDIEHIINEMSTHVSNIKEIAGVYDTYESGAVQMSGMLSGDVIE